MKLDYNLKLEQTQKLVITPELKLAIALLQSSALDLKEYLEEELLNNPVLEVAEQADEKASSQPVEDLMESLLYAKDQSWEEQIFEPEAYKSSGRNDHLDVNRLNGLHNDKRTLECKTLYEDLLAQLRMLDLEPHYFNIAAFLAGNLDNNGYLYGEMDELSVSSGVSIGELEKGLAIIQKLEPPGVGSRNLKECLLLQLELDGQCSPLCYTIVKQFLPAAADGRYPYIASRLSCDEGDIREAVAYIRRLNPKPGSVYGGSDETRYILPDVIVEKVDNDYVVITNESVVPQLKINPAYKKMLTLNESHPDKELVAFIKNKLEKAYWLVRSLEQRRLTLTRVAQKIVDIQKPFFDEGVKKLKPLTLKDIANEVGVHESTVSRATATKYIQTPRGLFAMKYFFSSGLSCSGGLDLSSHGIKKYIEEFITGENPSKPLSDQLIADKLKSLGLTISRRTVAKYREEMSLLPSHKRRCK